MPARRIYTKALTNKQRQQRWRDRKKPGSRLAQEEKRRKREQAEAAAEAGLAAAGVGWCIDTGDFRQWQPPQPANLILTDPPYAREHLGLYRDLPERADAWLADQGWLAVMCGNRWLPEVLASLSAGPLEYVWWFTLVNSAGTANGIQFLPVQNIGKPVILLRKGTLRLREMIADVIHYEWQGTRDEGLHRWQQETSPLQKLIRAMTEPGGLVADPFCGSGTTGIAACTTGRQFAGCDSDATAAITARARLRLAGSGLNGGGGTGSTGIASARPAASARPVTATK